MAQVTLQLSNALPRKHPCVETAPLPMLSVLCFALPRLRTLLLGRYCQWMVVWDWSSGGKSLVGADKGLDRDGARASAQRHHGRKHRSFRTRLALDAGQLEDGEVAAERVHDQQPQLIGRK